MIATTQPLTTAKDRIDATAGEHGWTATDTEWVLTVTYRRGARDYIRVQYDLRGRVVEACTATRAYNRQQREQRVTDYLTRPRRAQSAR